MATYTKEEQAANRKKWVEALRSGKYSQASGILRNDTDHATGRKLRGFEYCCLGVACEISGLGVWGAGIDDAPDEVRRYIPHEDGDESKMYLLPESVREWLGIGTHDGALYDLRKDDEDLSTPGSLTQANDNGETFQQIADRIEAGQVITVEE